MSGESELKGVPELKASLEAFGDKVVKRVLRKALRAGAKIIKAALVAAAPVRTGRTVQAIKVQAGKRSRKNFTSMMVTLGAGLFKGATFYAGFVEYGWKWSGHKLKRAASGRFSKSGAAVGVGGGKKIPGRNWMRKAAKAAEANCRQAVVESMRAGLDEEVAAARARKGGT